MLITVIVPTRCRASLLRNTLAALSLQTYTGYEVLVIDDGSDTATRVLYPSLFAELGDRFRYVQVGTDGQRGQGPSASRNLGISLARGDVFAFCDDDDVWVDAGHLAAVADLFQAEADVGVCISNQRAVFVDGKVAEQWLPALSGMASALPVLSGRYRAVSMPQLCNSGGFGHLNMLCVRRSVVERVGGFWEAVNYEEDRDFFWRCVDASTTVAYTPTTVAQHHVPDPARRINVSSAIQQQERWLIAAMVSRHIAVSVKSRLIVQLCLAHEGDLLRRLALHCKGAGQLQAAAGFARQALGARFSIKWAAYSAWVWLRSFRRA